MHFKKYALYNTVLGWVAFAIAAYTYLSTQEPSVSLWDCGEFIPASSKLEVVHPPGAPFFLMFNHLLSAFSFGDATMVPILVNASSALSSAFAILFLFWTITALAVKLVFKDEENISLDQVVAVLGAGLVGALAYTWSDTFWFSAVEGEVYALSSCFIALVSWLMVKWERRAHEEDHLRWIVLIAFLIGVSTGVHLLSLLAVPAMAYVYYFKKVGKPDMKGILLTGVVGLAVLGSVQIGVIIGIPNLISKFELVFVNTMGMPFWSGAFFFLALLVGGLIFGIYRTRQKGQVVANTIVTCFAVIVLGYSSYAMVVIRSMANPPIDMNDPEDVFSLLSYLNREQYGDNPLLKGPNYTAYTQNAVEYKRSGKMQYVKGKDKYEKIGRKQEEIVEPKHLTLFPRMYSRQDHHVQKYREWAGLRKKQIPSLGDNIKYFMRYQLNHMWFRYFAWNFIGRQNDTQGHGSFDKGNWITGIDGLDRSRIGSVEDMPSHFLEHKARNLLYGLPFILGLLGMAFHFMNDKRSAIAVLVYFAVTGMALAVYLNMPMPAKNTIPAAVACLRERPVEAESSSSSGEAKASMALE